MLAPLLCCSCRGRENPPGDDSFGAGEELVCTFKLKSSEGLMPKFHCVLPGGEVIKVKYGRRMVEVRTEVAATRLLAALGFGADRMYVGARFADFPRASAAGRDVNNWVQVFRDRVRQIADREPCPAS